MNEKILIRILEVFPFAIVFLYTIRYPLNLDIGWHLKNGEYLIKNGQIVDTNFYSTLMDGLEYVNLGWIIDGIIYLVFNSFSFIGIGILSATVFTLIFFVLSRITNMDYWQKLVTFPVFLFLANPLIIKDSFTTQAVSLLLTAIIIYLLTLYKKHRNIVIVSILLTMLMWPNFHGQFIFGFVVIGIWIVSGIIKEFIEKRRVNLKEYLFPFLLLLGSFLATLINPYGIYFYREIFLQYAVGYPVLSLITEWAPPFISNDTTIIYLALIGIYIASLTFLAYKKSVTKNLFFVLLPVPFLLQATMQIRILYVALIMIIPLFSLMINELRLGDYKYIKYGYLSVLVAMYLYVLFSFPLNTFIRNNWDYYCLNVGCSDKAARYLINNNLQEDLYTQYNFGGWFIWNYYPEIKPLIDGRMHLWNEDGYSGYLEYHDYLVNIRDINDGNYKTVYILKGAPVYADLQKLVEEEEWKMVYEYPYASIFTKNK